MDEIQDIAEQHLPVPEGLTAVPRGRTVSTEIGVEMLLQQPSTA
ncbi:hypothetical protein [Streptomyces sp. CC224B]|nr:hypothetical protein [Streptomyces sp. CC224B]